ncbi:uncharacterized protein TRIADDRAFT_23113 [Trichoplax adhaerens]|uniref:Uncharacterized protein n=1 Tax=Trichoplax adhaerens TaxID=10228 RepID=B3RSZ3_TRIAD|nr:hypothetical protein TRIADDRAFT_23113 [Trichoplax adhaerens]EDV27134.1 hypothetical protein TRIADDRAFT_23113 [Trichoplax adhaerens]|eukprot:XP_002111130.1 hypothetical protein TRIADDRAFT_23113 [Trichoplax adhaerens]
MFWKFNYHQVSAIDSILCKENVTIEEVLDEDDVLQECKAQNTKLIEFLSRPTSIEAMVNYIVNEPSEDVDEKSRFKYPSTSCEILTCDVFSITENLVKEPALTEKLWSFLDNESPLNPLLASFFSKTVGILLKRNTEATFNYLCGHDGVVNTILKHFNTSAIMDLLMRLVTCTENPQLKFAILKWLDEESLITKLILLINPAIESEMHSYASQVLCDIIRQGRERLPTMVDSELHDPLLRTIERQETVQLLIENMLQETNGERCDSAIVSGIQVLLAMIDLRRTSEQLEDASVIIDTKEFAEVDNEIQGIIPRLRDLTDLLKSPPRRQAMRTTAGLLQPPLGNVRLHVAKLVSALLLTNVHAVNVELAKLGTLELLWDLFFKYSWNNFLHLHVEQCIVTILTNTPNEEDGARVSPLINTLFQNCRILEKIVDNWEDNEKETANPHGQRGGHMGYLTRIANTVATRLERGPNKEILQSYCDYTDLAEDIHGRWDQFISGSLKETNKRNAIELVKPTNSGTSSISDEDDFPRAVTGNLPKIYNHYQMSDLGPSMIDKLSYDEDEFQDDDECLKAHYDALEDVKFKIDVQDSMNSANIFEERCNEKMAAFDETTEDVWEEREFSITSESHELVSFY